MHGREEEAEATIEQIEQEVIATGHPLEPVDESKALEIKPEKHHTYRQLVRVLFKEYPSRSVLGATPHDHPVVPLQLDLLHLHAGADQVLRRAGHARPPLFLIAFAVGNLAGPLTIGRLFDTVGRKQMISGTYLLSGVLLAITAVLFDAGVLTATTQTIAWCVIFFFASAGASAAYLTVSEIFPLEIRAQAIAVFFAIAQCFGALGPLFYGWLIGDGRRPGQAVHRLPDRRRGHGGRRPRGAEARHRTPRASRWRTWRVPLSAVRVRAEGAAEPRGLAST